MKEILLDIDLCNGCLNCVVACAVEHSESKTILGAMLEKAKPRLTVEVVKGKPIPILCRHCTEPACVDACMAGAMLKDEETGIVTNEGNGQDCVGCWMCVMACPYGVILQSKEPERKAIKCDRCPGREIPGCVQACPNGALIFDEPDNFSRERQKRLLVVTEHNAS